MSRWKSRGAGKGDRGAGLQCHRGSGVGGLASPWWSQVGQLFLWANMQSIPTASEAALRTWGWHTIPAVSVTAMITLSCVWQWLGHAATSLLDSQPLESAALSSLPLDLPRWLAHYGQCLHCTGLHTWHPLTSFNQPPFLCSIYWDYLQTLGDEGTPLKLYSRLVTAPGFAPKEKKIIF